MRPLRFQLSDLCEKHELATVIDVLILVCQEQRSLNVSLGTPDAETIWGNVICALEECRNHTDETAWH